MERLTKRVDVGGLCEIADVDEQDLDDAIERLADYEDTGHMPEDIEALKAENEMLRATIEAKRKIKLETMHDFLDKYGIDYDCGWRYAIDGIIADLRAENERLKRKQRWIPVSEGLPKDGQEVLVYARGMVHMAAFYKEDGWMYATVSSPDEEDITHWKIPDAPKEAGNR